MCTPHNDWLLYGTVGAPYEQANLVYWYDHQEAKERCHRRLVRWIAETGDAFEMPDIKLEGAARVVGVPDHPGAVREGATAGSLWLAPIAA